MSGRKEKLREWIQSCKPEKAEFDCVGCPFRDFCDGATVQVPVMVMEEIRKLLEED